MQTEQPQQPIKLSPSLNILKFLVIAMGITMIVGFLFLLGVVYRTVGKEKQSECASATISLEQQGRISAIANGRLCDKHLPVKIKILQSWLCPWQLPEISVY